MIFDSKLPYNDRQNQLIVVTSFCLIVSTIAVVLRLIARRQFSIKLWWDDYICIVALVGGRESFPTCLPRVLTIY